MSTTNGSKATPSRDEVLRLSTYYAAVEGYFDTSEATQKSGQLTISVMDMVYSGRPLPAGASYQFYVMVNQTGWMVTYYHEQPDDRYEVAPHDQTKEDQAERELREAVLDTALWYLTAGDADYHAGAGPEARVAAIKGLLEEGLDEQEEREEADPVPHPVIRDVLPDVTAHSILRQWFVQIGGPWNVCEVGLIGYKDGRPEFITMEPEDEEEDEE